MTRTAKSKAGITLVEVMIALFLVGVAAAIVYAEMIMAYRILMRSRARVEAQGLAFERLWEVYNTPLDQMPLVSTNWISETTPAGSVLSTNGLLECMILAETNPPVLPDPVYYWDIVVQVWASADRGAAVGGPLNIVTNPLCRYTLRRYRGNR